jgi:RNA polymerase sigma-70 factor (ECF subfamily)
MEQEERTHLHTQLPGLVIHDRPQPVVQRAARHARYNKKEHEWISHLPQANNGTEEHVYLRDTQQLVNEAMQLLTTQQREAFELFKMRGLSREETALAMDISPNTVKVHLLHALRTIRAYLVNKNVGSIYIIASFPIFLEKI